MPTLLSRLVISCWLVTDFRKECMGAFSGSSCMQHKEAVAVFESTICDNNTADITVRLATRELWPSTLYGETSEYLPLPPRCHSRPFSCPRGRQRCVVVQ